MNIVVATGSYPSKDRPQRGVFLERDVHGLVSLGHRVTCLIARNRLRDRNGHTPSIDGLTIREVKALSLSSIKGWEGALAAFAQRNVNRALRSVLRRTSPDSDVVYAKFLNTAPLLPHVASHVARVLGVGEGLDSIHERLIAFKPGEVERCVEAADIIEVKNSQVAAWFADTHHCAGKIRVVPSGVDTAYFEPGDRTAARAILGIGADAFVVAAVGSRNENKGGDRLIAAASSCAGPDITPVMAGPGWEKSHAGDWVGLGVVPPSSIRLLLQAADVFFQGSLSEGMPNALLEALAAGLPCIVADRPYADFLDHGRNCWKFDALSAAELRRGLEEMRDSIVLRDSLGAEARRTAGGLSQESRTHQLESIFTEAISLRRNHS
jgi:glycosyltransferase involved in cell wall biosynthesis